MEAELTQNHTHRANRSLTKGVAQRSQSYQVYNEVYHTSPKQQEVKKELNYNVTTMLDYQLNFKFARMSTNLILDDQRGVRATQSRKLSDGTPSPAYMVEWVSSIQTDLLSKGTLKVE